MPKTKTDEILEVGNELVFASGQEKELYFDEKGELTTDEFDERVLIGDEAMKYLIGKTRPNQQLIMGDHRAITQRFRPLSECQDKDRVFWSKFKIRVWKVANVGQKTASLNLKTGKDTAGNNIFLRHDGGKYTGDIFDGRALEGFVPNIAISPKHNEYRVQLISVTVSEEMSRVRS